MKSCIYCKKSLNKWAKLYCSNKCQSDYSYQQYIAKWKQGNIVYNDILSHHIIKYIFKKYRSRCNRCSWAKINPVSGRLSLEIDHIDGNSHNHGEVNLTLLCPNCHSLTPTYKNLNKGNGRLSRRRKYGSIVFMPL